jgi:hypothetical protein
MLVYLKEPMGYSTIEGKRVYGRYYSYGSFGPTDIPRKVYFKHRDVLEEVKVTGDWLSKKTGKVFPSVSFRTTRMSDDLDLETTIEIAELLGIKYIRTKKTDRAALHRAIVKRIELL